MKKLTSILAALYFIITAAFAADNSKTIEVDLAAGTSAGFGNNVRLEWKDTDKTYCITQQKGMGTINSLIEDNVASPILEGGQYFVFTTSTNTIDEYKQITSISITYDGENYGDLTVGSAYSSSTGVVTIDPLFNANLSTTANGTHTFTIAGGGATDVYIQNKKDASSIKVTKITFTVNTPIDPELEEPQTDTATVTTMQEVITALGSRSKITVLYKNLKPITKGSGLQYDDYMPDGTTPLKINYSLPADFDCYGTYAKNLSGKYVFTVDSITNIYAFANPYLLESYYNQNSNDPNIAKDLNITEPVVVTAVEGSNVFVQYAFARIDDSMFGEQLVINGDHTLKVGDQIASFAARYNKETSLSLDEENTTLVRNAFFAVEASSLGEITANSSIKYKAISNISNIASYAASAVQLPTGGIIVKKDNKYFYKIEEDSLEIRPAANVEINFFVGEKMKLSIKGVIDYCNTANSSNAIIVNSIQEIDTNYESISQWLNAASEGNGEGTLKNPVVVTHSEYRNSKQFIFIGDATGGLCLVGTYEQGKIDSIKIGDLLTGITGKLDLSDSKKAPQLSIPNSILVVDSGKTIEPIEVTIAELLKEENDAINNGRPAIKYANRLVKIRKVVKGDKYIGNNPRIWPLIQNGDTLTYATNTLKAYETNFSTTTPMCIVAIVDFRTINSSYLYSIYPRSTEDIKDDFEQPVISPKPGTYYGEELEITISCEDPATTAIYYSFDPEIDPRNDGEEYEGPITLTQDTTIWYAVEYGEKISELYEASYKIRPESEKVVSAKWNIEEGQVLESFENVTVTFEGVDSVGRRLDGVEVTEVISATSAVQILYSIAEDGTATPFGILPATKNGLTITYSVGEDKGYNLVNGKFLKNGNYRIVIPAGVLTFNPRRTDENGVNLPVVKNDKEFILNFSIKNNYVEPIDPTEVDATFTANPEDNSTLTSISEIIVTFTDKTSITLSELGETPRPDIWPFLTKEITTNNDDELGGAFDEKIQLVAPMYCEIIENTPNAVRFYIASDLIDGTTEITTEGSYTLSIPAGVIMFSETETNKPISLNYTVKEGTNIDLVIINNMYTTDGTIVAEGDFQIFTVTGQNVTAMNGNLPHGVYVIKAENSVTKVVVK